MSHFFVTHEVHSGTQTSYTHCTSAWHFFFFFALTVSHLLKFLSAINNSAWGQR